MQHRNLPARRSDSILLYGFGLALASSLAFNGYLLYEQSRQRSAYENELGTAVHAGDLVVWQQYLSDCKRNNQQKDSLISRLEQVVNMPPVPAVTAQQMPPK